MPVLKLLISENTYARNACKWLISINLIGMLITGLQYLMPFLGGTVSTFQIFHNLPVALVLIGHKLHKNQNVPNNRTVRNRFLFIVGMAGIVAVRFVVLLFNFSHYSDNNYINYWNTTFSLIFSVCFICFFLTFPAMKKSPYLRMINYIGTKTYTIYIIHMAVYAFFESRNIREQIYANTIKIADNVIAKLGYDLILPVIIFVCSLLISIVFDGIKIFLCSIYRLIVNRRKNA